MESRRQYEDKLKRRAEQLDVVMVAEATNRATQDGSRNTAKL